MAADHRGGALAGYKLISKLLAELLIGGVPSVSI